MSERTRYVYAFGRGRADGDATMVDILGGKGANLAEMTRLGLPVPAGFTISTAAALDYFREGKRLPAGLQEEVRQALQGIEQAMGRSFGDEALPLLVSVRSGAAASMPGMMDTVLNLGLNDAACRGLATSSQNDRFARDSYRRFIQMFADVVMGVKLEGLERILEARRQAEGVREDHEISSNGLAALIADYKKHIVEVTDQPFPDDPLDQLWAAIGAVFDSWNNKRARDFRDAQGIPHDLGTAVTVQAMVYGNLGDDCATGVAFTRNPSTGESAFYGEYLPNAQGEDVVAGIRTPMPITAVARQPWDDGCLEESMPEVYDQLVDVARKLEGHFRDMQDIEFTVQQGTLYLLQTRTGKRTAQAALRIATDMVDEALIDPATAVRRVEPTQLDQLLHPSFAPGALQEARDAGRLVIKGLPASPGAVSGQVVFTAADAVDWATRGRDVVLLRNETSPDDIQGMTRAKAVVTARGGMTSHAAVVARGMGTCCVVGCASFRVDTDAGLARLDDGSTLIEGALVSVDGSTGEVFVGDIDTVQPELGGEFSRLMGWADAVRRLRVRANADTERDAEIARGFGAEGIGLCRTEHMFFSEGRIQAVREMILAADEDGRRRALEKIRPMQREDFEKIFGVMGERPCTIRLLDPPLHEFLPHSDEEVAGVAEASGRTSKEVRRAMDALHETNPMLGHRGCRLGISYPEIYEMQTEAIMEAACAVSKSLGIVIRPEIMIPLVGTARELELLRDTCTHAALRVLSREQRSLAFQIGTMIELPRAALRGGAIAEHADFFSFGTNDLTQTTLGISRDDAAGFLPTYLEHGIFNADPFAALDDAVAELLTIGTQRGRQTKPQLKVGICGEHGGSPQAIEHCESLDFDYVSCSPYRVPIARLAAAHATLKRRESGSTRSRA